MLQLPIYLGGKNAEGYGVNEIELTQKIKNMIKREFPDAYIQRVSDRFLSGIPDLRVISYGLSGDIEVKLPNSKASKTSAIQDKILEYISAAGGAVAVVKSVDEARIFMIRLQRKGRVLYESGICQNP